MKLKSKPELLSPAGAPECINAAVQNGCSAIYVGCGPFNARKNAKNFTYEELENAIDYCHLRDVKLYVTANTLIKNSEITPFLRFVEQIYKMGADGIIIQDIGMATLIKESFPDFYLLASTQMTIHDCLGADYLYSQGFQRIILSRELSLKEIEDISKSSQAELECFIHGALCVCYSGQCLMSAFNGGRSGNRGLCAQPCRLRYQLFNGERQVCTGSLLSPKDMMGLGALPGLIESGVSSFKIEGRMKSPEYVAGVTAIYRKYIDLYYENPQEYKVLPEDEQLLAQIFNRSGFNEGYFFDYSGKAMLTDGKVGNTGVQIGTVEKISNRKLFFHTTAKVSPGDGVEIYISSAGENPGGYITKSRKAGEAVEIDAKDTSKITIGSEIYRTFDKALNDQLKQSFARDLKKSAVTGILTAMSGKKLILAIKHVSTEITVIQEGIIVEKAENAPVKEEKLREQLEKTGATAFFFETLEISMEENIFLPISAVNDLRRNALEKLKNEIIIKSKRTKELSGPAFVLTDSATAKDTASSELVIRLQSTEQLRAVAELGISLKRIVLEDTAIEQKLLARVPKETEVFLGLPVIARNQDALETLFKKASRYQGILVRSYGQMKLAQERNVPFAADYTLGVYNDAAYGFLKAQGADSVCISPELSLGELERLSGRYEMLAYGRIPLMTTVQCPIGNFYSGKDKGMRCKKHDSSGAFFLRARVGDYPLMPQCANCTCKVLTERPVDISTEIVGKRNLPVVSYVLAFTTESYVDCKNIMSTYIDLLCKNARTLNNNYYLGQYLNGVK